MLLAGNTQDLHQLRNPLRARLRATTFPIADRHSGYAEAFCDIPLMKPLGHP